MCGKAHGGVGEKIAPREITRELAISGTAAHVVDDHVFFEVASLIAAIIAQRASIRSLASMNARVLN
jgi:hypothetical protein